MPKNVEIEIFKIGQTAVQPEAVQRWLTFIGVHRYTEDFLGSLDSQSGADLDNESSLLTDPAGIIALAAKRCYMSFEPGLNPNVTKVRSDFVEYFDNILRSGHGSVLEHATFTFAIENVSRVFTAEMNRHRAGWAISEGSLRFIRFDKDIPYWIPPSLQGPTILKSQPDYRTPDLDQIPVDLAQVESEDDKLSIRKQLSRESFDRVFRFVEAEYGYLLKVWDMDDKDKNFHYKKTVTSALRRIVPLGVATGGVWTGNVRALRHVLAMRCSPAAEEEIAFVFSRIAEQIVTAEPLLFGDFHLAGSPAFWQPKYPKV